MAPPKHPSLTPAAIKRIYKAIEDLYDRAKIRLLGPSAVPKRIYFSHSPFHSLPGLFSQAAKEEGVRPNEQVLHQLLQVAGSYLDAQKERTKARVVNEVSATLTEAHHAGVDTDLPTVLGGKLSEVWGETANNVRRIVETEATHTRNVGVLEGISRVNAAAGIEDATIFFVVVHDDDLCSECERIHLMEDGKTPRLYRMSEVGAGYHKKGQNNPKMGGLHPNCRCSITTLMPGYGFNSAGLVVYVKKGHDELAKQRGE